MGDKECKGAAVGFGEGGSGHGGCPYGFGSGSHSGHGHGGPGHCPYLHAGTGGRGFGGRGFGGRGGFRGHGGFGGRGSFGGHGGHGFDHHHGVGHHQGHHDCESSMFECPWMVARLHACPWAWGVGSGHHQHGGKSGKSGCDFCVTLNVTDFCSEDLEVKVVGQEVIVIGKHEPRPDPADSSTVSREFTRRYELPDNIDPQTVASCLNEDHELMITANKKVVEGESRVVPIQVGEGSGDN